MKNNLFLSSACLALCFGAILLPSSGVSAQELGSLYYYPLTQSDYQEHYHEWRVFQEYNESREPCQGYQSPPAGYVMRGCDVYALQSQATPPMQTTTETVTKTSNRTTSVEPEVSTFTIYFDFDKSNIRASEEEKIAQAVHDINEFKPKEIRVAAYTDRSGSATYNQRLSERRAQSVSHALAAQMDDNQEVDRFAYGESNSAVETSDGSQLQDNRRVVISFKH